jgi:hypothetical protein
MLFFSHRIIRLPVSGLPMAYPVDRSYWKQIDLARVGIDVSYLPALPY